MSEDDERIPPGVDVTAPSIARVYDYMLGGKDNFAIDRQVAEMAISHFHNPGAEHPEVAEQAAASEKLFNERLGTGRWRTREEILPLFGSLELLAPGLVPLPLWRPYPGITPQLGPDGGMASIHHALVGGVARKA
jgi:S-adenosyl methyltransferase